MKNDTLNMLLSLPFLLIFFTYCESTDEPRFIGADDDEGATIPVFDPVCKYQEGINHDFIILKDSSGIEKTYRSSNQGGLWDIADSETVLGMGVVFFILDTIISKTNNITTTHLDFYGIGFSINNSLDKITGLTLQVDPKKSTSYTFSGELQFYRRTMNETEDGTFISLEVKEYEFPSFYGPKSFVTIHKLENDLLTICAHLQTDEEGSVTVDIPLRALMKDE